MGRERERREREERGREWQKRRVRAAVRLWPFDSRSSSPDQATVSPLTPLLPPSPLQLPGLARVLAIWWLLFMQDTAPVSGRRSHVNLPLASDANAHFYAFTHMSPLSPISLPLSLCFSHSPPVSLGIHRVFRISHGPHMPC